MKDWLSWSAARLGRGIGAGEIDPEALCETYLDAARDHRHGGRIYTWLTADRARAEAAAAAGRARAGQRRGPLDGVPISWKDLFDSAGVFTEAGSDLLAGREPARDAEVLANATAAGLVCLGKTQMSELAFSGLGYNPVKATPPCVNDEEAVAGGSSSGAAASVAFGMAAAGIGSDTGGSVRVPAAWNDLVGLKTTAGRVSCRGVVPLAPRFDTVGPLCRSVEDAALLLAALEGGRAADLRGARAQGLRLAVLETIALEDIDDAPRSAFEDAVARLQDAGALVERIGVEAIRGPMANSVTLYSAEAYGTWKREIDAAPDRVYSEILQRFHTGRDVLASDYVQAWHDLDAARAEWAGAVAGFDAVLVPTVPILPPNLKRLEEGGDYYKHANLMALRNTRIGNLMGLCALTLPTGVPSCGISLLGRPMQEERLLRVGAAVEAALG